MRRRQLAMVLALQIAASPAWPQAMLDLKFGTDTTIEHHPGGQGAEIFTLHQPSRDVSTSIDAGTPFSAWSAHDQFHHRDSLAIRIDPEHRPLDVSQKSKFEINVSRQDDYDLDQIYHDHYILKNNSSNFLGFALKLDTESYDAPKRWVLHFQVWQCCSTQTIPPLAFQAIPDPAASSEAVRFSMIKRNDDYLARDKQSHSDYGEHITFMDGAEDLPLRRGQWYRFVIFLKPDPGTSVAGRMQSRAGEIDMWIDGRQVLHHVGAWGYTPNDSGGIRDTYAVKLGIYRAAQDARQQVYFNDIRWGTDKRSVDPDQP